MSGIGLGFEETARNKTKTLLSPELILEEKNL